MKTFSVYEIESGRLTGARIGASGDVDPDWIPAGCSVVLGEWDHERWRVDHETGELEAIEPPAPDWRIRMFAAVDEVMAEILAAEAEQARPLREIVEAMLAGTTPPADAVARMSSLTQTIKAARVRRAELMAAESAEDLEELGL